MDKIKIKLLYKCRRCGKEKYVNCYGGHNLKLVYANFYSYSDVETITKEKIIFHKCHDKFMGVMDLIGADVEEVE